MSSSQNRTGPNWKTQNLHYMEAGILVPMRPREQSPPELNLPPSLSRRARSATPGQPTAKFATPRPDDALHCRPTLMKDGSPADTIPRAEQRPRPRPPPLTIASPSYQPYVAVNVHPPSDNVQPEEHIRGRTPIRGPSSQRAPRAVGRSPKPPTRESV